MDKYCGQLDLSEEEIQEIDENPQLLHLYNAKRIWEDIKTGQDTLEALLSIWSDPASRFSQKSDQLMRAALTKAQRKAD